MREGRTIPSNPFPTRGSSRICAPAHRIEVLSYSYMPYCVKQYYFFQKNPDGGDIKNAKSEKEIKFRHFVTSQWVDAANANQIGNRIF